MSSIRDIKLPPIKEESIFEELCLNLWRRILNDKHVQLNGRRGQKQDGVDIFGLRDETFNWVGIQCKVKTANSKLSENEIVIEIEKAKKFNPKLAEYIIATTMPRDQKLQEISRLLTQESRKKGGFSVNIFFWDDIELELALEKNIDLVHKYYEKFILKSDIVGNAIGKLAVIQIGIDRKPDTRYELMIGKTPVRKENENFYGINYYKDCYFIINLNYGRFDTFPIPCYLSDIEHVFDTNRDAYIISEWLNSIDNLNNLIYGDPVDFEFTIPFEKFQRFIGMSRE